MKEHGRHYLDNHNYKDIHMPNNTHRCNYGYIHVIRWFLLNLRNYNPCCNLLSRYSWFISLPSFVQDHGYHIPASEVAENEARLRSSY